MLYDTNLLQRSLTCFRANDIVEVTLFRERMNLTGNARHEKIVQQNGSKINTKISYKAEPVTTIKLLACL